MSSYGVSLQQNLNKKYLDELKEFLKDINQVFSPVVYNWNSNLNIPNFRGNQGSQIQGDINALPSG